MKSVEHYRQGYESVLKEKRQAEADRDAINERLSGLEAQMPELAQTVKDFAVQKAELFSLFAKGKSSRDDLDMVSEAYERAVREERDTQELIEVVRAELEAVKNSISAPGSGIEGKAREAERLVWRALMEEKRAEIKTEVGEKIKEFYAMIGLSSAFYGPGLFEHAVVGIFDAPQDSELKELRQGLREKYNVQA